MTKLPIPDLNDIAQPKENDRRKCKRVPISFPIEVSGSDRAGQPFCNLTATTDVSERGCRFDILREVRRGDVVTIQMVRRISGKPSKTKALRFEVVWAVENGWGWSIGAAKLQTGNFWHVVFPKQSFPPISL